jgi:hypothetical protein
LAQNPEIQEALAARAFVSQQSLAKLDEAFSLIGEKPVNVTGRLHDVFVEDFRGSLRRSNHRRRNGSSYWQRPIT